MRFTAGWMQKLKPNLIKSKPGFNTLLFLRNGGEGRKNDDLYYRISDRDAYRVSSISGVLVSAFAGDKIEYRPYDEWRFKRRNQAFYQRISLYQSHRYIGISDKQKVKLLFEEQFLPYGK